VTDPMPVESAERLLDGAGLGPFVWSSSTLLAAIIDEELLLAAVSPKLEQLVQGAGPLSSAVGSPATRLVAANQAEAFRTALAEAGPTWTEHHFGLGLDDAGLPADYRLLVRGRGGLIVLVGEPDVAGPARISDLLLAMNEDLLTDQRRIVIDRNRLSRLSTTDPLTELGNRRLLEDLLPRLVEAAFERSEPLSVVFADIDRFKAVNDTFGHAAGDEVIAFVGGLLKETSRGADIVARFGGEEFVAMLPACDLEGAVRWAERARRRHERTPAPGVGAPVTLSFGVAALGPGEAAKDLLARADAALYAAKEAGRNRVVASGTPERGGSGRRTSDVVGT